MEDVQEAADRPFAQAKLQSEEDCPICGDKAAKHVHYGARTCFSCRAFFRRSIQNKTADNYVCRRTGTCEINLKTRKNCQFCRFEKCLTVGMKRSGVLSEEERDHRFRKSKTTKHATSEQEKAEAMDLSDQFEHGVNLNHPQSLNPLVIHRQQLSPLGVSPIASPASPNGSSNGGVDSAIGSLSPLAQFAAASGGSSQLKMHNGHTTKSPPPFSAVLNGHHRVLTAGGSSSLTAVINGQSDSSGSSQNKQLGVIRSPSQQMAGLSVLLPQSSANGSGATLQNRGASSSALSPPHMALIKQEVITSAEKQQLLQQQLKQQLLLQQQLQHKNGRHPQQQQQQQQQPRQLLVNGRQLFNGGGGLKGGGTPRGSLNFMNVHQQQPTSLNIKEEPNLSNLLVSSRPGPTTTTTSFSHLNNHHQPQTYNPQAENEDLSPLSPEEALRVVQTAPYDDISVLLGANGIDHDLQESSSGESNLTYCSGSDRISNNRSPYDYNNGVPPANTSLRMAGNGGLPADWYPQLNSNNSFSTTSSLAGTASPLAPASSAHSTIDGSAPATPTPTLHSSDYDEFLGEDGYSNSNDFLAMLTPITASTACFEPLAVNEEEYLKTLVMNHDASYKSVNFGEELIKEMIMCSMFGIAISTRAALTGYRLSVDRMTRIAKNLDVFNQLLMMDQEALLHENADLLVSLRGAIFFESRKKGLDQVLVSMGVEDMESIKTMFSQLMKKDNANLKHINYSNFNSVQEEGSKIKETRYDFLLAKVGNLLSDDCVVVLITMIVLFSGDFCNLQNRALVEQTQVEFATLLRKYFNTHYPRMEAMLRFANTLEIISLIREMADIKKSRKVKESVHLATAANQEAYNRLYYNY